MCGCNSNSCLTNFPKHFFSLLKNRTTDDNTHSWCTRFVFFTHLFMLIGWIKRTNYSSASWSIEAHLFTVFWKQSLKKKSEEETLLIFPCKLKNIWQKKFYYPGYAPPKVFCSSNWIHYVTCTQVWLHGLQENRFNFSVTAAWQNAGYQVPQLQAFKC